VQRAEAHLGCRPGVPVWHLDQVSLDVGLRQNKKGNAFGMAREPLAGLPVGLDSAGDRPRAMRSRSKSGQVSALGSVGSVKSATHRTLGGIRWSATTGFSASLTFPQVARSEGLEPPTF
jgi:hypothetical protein